MTRGSRSLPRIGRTDGWFVFRLQDVGEFAIARDGGRFCGEVVEGAHPESVAWFVMRGLVPRVLQLRGTPVLHASAVAGDSGLVAFTGWSGRGKSSLAAGLVQRGFRLVDDDTLPLRLVGGRPVGGPGLGRISLYPAMARHLGVGEGFRGRRSTQKGPWTPAEDQLEREPKEVRVVYVLDPPDRRPTQPPFARRGPVMPESRAFRSLVQGSMWIHPSESESAARSMVALAGIAKVVTVRRLAVGLTHRGFDAVARLVARDLA